MNDLSYKCYSELVASSEFSKNPHFYVLRPPGPDINNLLLDVLFIFRTGLLAFTADIETMFYKVKIRVQNLVRYVWWKDKPGNTEIDMRMINHPFGACSSPSIADFALSSYRLW